MTQSDQAGRAPAQDDAPKPSRSPTWRIAYPDELFEAEKALIDERRARHGFVPRARPATVGLALSGGGIRSATFSLGVLQSLAKAKLLARIDYLSTVSGGGYAGSFWSAWLSRNAAAESDSGHEAGARAAEPPKEHKASAFEKVQQALADAGSAELRWLRDNGRYLSPNGAGDLMTGVAVHLRNWVSIHVVLGALLLGVFLLLNSVVAAVVGECWGPGVTPAPFDEGGQASGVAGTCVEAAPGIPLSVWFELSLFPFAAAVLLGALYWVWPLNMAGTYRNRVSRWMTATLIVLGFFLVLAVTDTAGRVLYLRLADGDLWQRAMQLLAVAAPVVVSVIVGANKVLALLDTKAGESRLNIPMGLVAGATAAVLAFLWLTFWATNAQIASHHSPAEPLDASALFSIAAGVLFMAFLLANVFAFVNLSSLATLYADRLSRAYLGASNERRQRNGNRLVTETLDGDDIPMASYRPHRAGGPLHVINVTMNETVKESTRVEHRDSTGVPVAVGPVGLSVGIRHHASWVPIDPDPGEKLARALIRAVRRLGHALRREGFESVERQSRAKRALRAIGAEPDRFHCLAEAFTQGEGPRPIRSEELTLGQWVSVSGAAFTTGLGTRTSAGLSFLLGFFNIRLGHWWLSAVDPTRRAAAAKRDLRGHAAALFNWLFPAQSLLLDEMMGRFRGTARERWYLSDGGHFENTAAYELVRRRVQLIVILDNGCDPQYRFGDFATLVRKARIDFDAEIRPLDAAEIEQRFGQKALDWAGALTELTPGEDGASAKKYASLFAVHYEDAAEPGSFIVLIKPTLTGTEPVDLIHYSADHRPFPQQTTMDQFFDDAQWESYRKLGEWIGEAVLSSGAAIDACAAAANPPAAETLAGVA